MVIKGKGVQSTTTSPRDFIKKFFIGYLQHILLSASITAGLFLIFISVVFVGWNLLQLIDLFANGFYENVSEYFTGLSAYKLIYPYLENWNESIKFLAGWIAIIFPLILITIEKMFMKDFSKIKIKIIKKFFIIFSLSSVIFINIALLFSIFKFGEPVGEMITLMVIFSVVFLMSGVGGWALYRISNLFGEMGNN